MKKLTTRWYFSLLDIMEFYANQDSGDDSDELEWPIDLAPTNGFAEFCGVIADAEGVLSDDSPWGSVDTTLNQKMWSQYLWPEFKDEAVLYVDHLVNPWELEDEAAPTREEVWEVLKPMLPRFVRWLQESTDRYSQIIAALEIAKTKLMDQLGSSSLVLYNDTPQKGGDFTTDNHVTNATKTTSATDVTTPISRLQEIQEKLKSYYADWADEFSKFVIYAE